MTSDDDKASALESSFQLIFFLRGLSSPPIVVYVVAFLVVHGKANVLVLRQKRIRNTSVNLFESNDMDDQEEEAVDEFAHRETILACSSKEFVPLE